MVEHYSAIKNSHFLIHATIWMNLENDILSKKKPGTEGHILNDSVHMECPEQTKTRAEVVIAMGLGRQEWGTGFLWRL